MLVYFAEHAAGVADGDDVRGKVARDYAACAHHGVIADGHAGEHYDVRTQRVRADVDMRVVNGGEVEVCVYRVAEMDVRPPQFAWNGGSM